MGAAVDALAEHKLVVVALLLQRGGHRLVRLGPRAKLVDDVVAAVLLEDADGLARRGADQLGILVTAADVREAANGGEALAELVGPLPANGPGADAAAAAGGGSIVADLLGFSLFG